METAVEMKIPAKDLTLEGERGTVTLHPPFSDIGYSPIPVKLLSCRRKEGQVSVNMCMYLATPHSSTPTYVANFNSSTPTYVATFNSSTPTYVATPHSSTPTYVATSHSSTPMYVRMYQPPTVVPLCTYVCINLPL